jgi:hypothetical protein
MMLDWVFHAGLAAIMPRVGAATGIGTIPMSLVFDGSPLRRAAFSRSACCR